MLLPPDQLLLLLNQDLSLRRKVYRRSIGSQTQNCNLWRF